MLKMHIRRYPMGVDGVPPGPRERNSRYPALTLRIKSAMRRDDASQNIMLYKGAYVLPVTGALTMSTLILKSMGWKVKLHCICRD